jgi:HECT-domain (ubiquitin-transferase)
MAGAKRYFECCSGPGSIEHVFCQTFTAGVPGIGQPLLLPLVPGGEDMYVTEDNRRAFVEAYVDCILSRAVHRQFEVGDPHTNKQDVADTHMRVKL